MAGLPLTTFVPLAGFVLALIFGIVAHRTGFCTMGGIADAATFGDWRRLRMWALAAGVALVGAQLLHATGLVDLHRTHYTTPRIAWLAHVVGGFAFGVGMTLASGCGGRNLVRLGAGNLKSLVVLLALGLGAYMTLKGVLAVPRVRILQSVHVRLGTPQDLPAMLGEAFRLPIALLAGGGLVSWAILNRDFRRTRGYLVGGVAIGAIVVAGWYLTGHLGYVAEDPDTLESLNVGTNSRQPESFTYVAPVAYALELLLLWTDASLKVTFGIAVVVGTLLGAMGDALLQRRFRWESFASPGDLGNHVVGGVLMGFGGITAMGCSIGQGITGLSTLAVGSGIATVAIVAGCLVALRVQFARA